MHVKDLIVTGNVSVLGKTKINGYLPTAGGTMNGTIQIRGITSGSWTEGICINDAGNGWTTLRLGGTQESGTGPNSWSMHTYQSNFYIAHNGSSSSETGILSSDANGNWTIKNSIRVGAAQSPSASILRNSRLVPVDTNPTVNGEICWTYA